ncbi:MAG TPA: YncE family protein [Acidimicrobiales bacterium]|nr:YncE family protein [Acidimicrobiales bacterium]
MSRHYRSLIVVFTLTLAAAACGGDSPSSPPDDGSTTTGGGSTTPTTPVTTAAPSKFKTIPGMPPVIDDNNIYTEQGVNKLSDTVKGHKPLVYVPNNRSDSVVVIDPATFKVLRTVLVGKDPQHVVPSWDMTKLWVTNNAEGRTDGSLTPIDPVTGEFGAAIPVEDPYNMYYTPDGKSAVVVAEAFKRLDFRDPTTWQLQKTINTPQCAGINHADFSGDGTYAIFTCEFEAAIIKVDWRAGTVVGRISFGRGQAESMPQDVRVGPDGNTFYIADMMKNGLFIIDGETFTQTGFIKTGVGTHGIYPSRDGTKLFVANRGQNTVFGVANGKGDVSVVDPKTNTVIATWALPGGGSPDMGNLTPDGSQLWLSGRYDDEVYVFDTTTGALLQKIPVGQKAPHGLLWWPQPGRYSLGHTGNMR